MNVSVFIRPSLSPMDRGVIEDAVADALGEGVEFVGGGTFFGDGGGESDFTLEVPADRMETEVIETCRATLLGFVFTLPTELRLVIGEQTLRFQATIAEG